MKEVKVIHIIEGLNVRGAETFLLNLSKNINRDRF